MDSSNAVITLTDVMVVCWLISVIVRGLFLDRFGYKFKHTFYPGYNKYLMGKISGSKKLGILNAIFLPFSLIYFVFCFVFELYVIYNAASLAVGSDGSVYVEIPENYANIAIYSKYALVVVLVLTFIFWCLLCWNYIKSQKENPWNIVLWAFCPMIAYTREMLRDVIYVNDIEYSIQKIEVRPQHNKRNKK